MNDAILQVSNIVYRPMYKWTPLPNPTPGPGVGVI